MSAASPACEMCEWPREGLPRRVQAAEGGIPTMAIRYRPEDADVALISRGK